MRNKFDLELKRLNDELITMGAMCEAAISNSINALLNSDLEFADEAIRIEKEIDQKERDVEALCMRLLLQQQPVAKDLRLVSSALKMITDMERIGDQASDIAEIVKNIDSTATLSNKHIDEISKATIKMVTNSIDAFVKSDIKLAEQVIAADDVVDDLFNVIRNDIIKLITEDEKYGEQAIDIIMITKYLERIGDHAVNIAEWVVYSITGVHVKE